MKRIIKFAALLFIGVFVFASCKKESNKDRVLLPLPVPAVGELFYLKNLSIPRNGVAGAAAGSKIIFAGGYAGESSVTVYSRIDIYDTVSQTWSTAELSEARAQIGAIPAGNKILFAGGAKQFDYSNGWRNFSSRIDIYDISTNSWSTAELPEPISFFGEGAVPVSAGKLAFFYQDGASNIHIYDVANNSWSTAQISEPRAYLAAASDLDHTVFFAGGVNLNGQFSKRVDLYNSVSQTWSIDSLTEARAFLKATTVNSKTLFAGGALESGSTPSMTVDIHNNAFPGWSVGNLSKAIAPGFAVTQGDKAIFIDGSHVEVYNGSVDSWSVSKLYFSTLSYAVANGATAVITSGGRVFVAGGVFIVKNQDYYPEYIPQWGVWMTRF